MSIDLKFFYTSADVRSGCFLLWVILVVRSVCNVVTNSLKRIRLLLYVNTLGQPPNIQRADGARWKARCRKSHKQRHRETINNGEGKHSHTLSVVQFVGSMIFYYLLKYECTSIPFNGFAIVHFLKAWLIFKVNKFRLLNLNHLRVVCFAHAVY